MTTILYKEEDSPLLKEWIIKRLENTSDADADVLADYVLALLQHDGDEATIRKLCEVELRPFLSDDDFTRFISDIFKGLIEKLYLPPSRRPPPQKQPLSYMYDPSKPLERFGPNPTPMRPQQLNTSRKRSYHDRFEGEAQPPSLFEAQRTYKQPRRGGHSSVQGGHGSANGQHSNGVVGGGQFSSSPLLIPPPPPVPGAANLPPRPPQRNDVAPGPSSLPPNLFGMNPEAANFAPSFTQTSARQTRNFHGPRKRKNERCRQFDAKGTCKRGLTCPYEHVSQAQAIPSQQPPSSTSAYPPFPPHLLRAGHPSQILLPAISAQPDPDLEEGEVAPENRLPPYFPQAHPVSNFDDEDLEIVLDMPPPFVLPQFPSFNGRGGSSSQRGRGGRRGRGKARAQFSLDGPSHDRNVTAVVVENIPELYFDESNVRQHFSQYGNIVDISMRPYKHLVIVKYDSWASANKAYRSPQVIFDNRFVKVYWYNEDADKPEALVKWEPAENGAGSNGFGAHATESEEPEFNMEEFLQKQEEAQKIYEEKKQKREELTKQKEDLDRRQQELLAKQLEIRAKLDAKLNGQGQPSEGDVDESATKSTTDALRAQLKKLEAEARILGVDAIKEEEGSTDGFAPPFSGYRGRGGFRGRGGYRGGYHGSSRGGYGGGVFGDVHEAYAAYSLDNRPKRVAITGVDLTEAEKDEKLRHYLLVLGEHDNNVETTPNVTLVTFKERRTAEAFMNTIKGTGIPGLDVTLEATWVPNGTPPPLMNGSTAKTVASASSTGAEQIKNGDDTHAQAQDMPDAPTADHEEGEVHEQEEPQRDQVMDYDVADDEQWGH